MSLAAPSFCANCCAEGVLLKFDGRHWLCPQCYHWYEAQPRRTPKPILREAAQIDPTLLRVLRPGEPWPAEGRMRILMGARVYSDAATESDG